AAPRTGRTPRSARTPGHGGPGAPPPPARCPSRRTGPARRTARGRPAGTRRSASSVLPASRSPSPHAPSPPAPRGATQRGQAPFALVPARTHGSTRSGGKLVWCAPRGALTDALQTERRLRVPRLPSQGAFVASRATNAVASLVGRAPPAA